MSTYRADDRPFDRRRIASMLAVIVVHLVLGYALLRGLGVELPPVVTNGLATFTVPTSPPPPPARHEPRHRVSPRKEGAAAPPNLRAKATEVVAPIPIVPPIQPPPITAAPIAGIGAASSAGAAPMRGPGSGAGGVGEGTGSGGEGNGDGGGGGGSPPELIAGRVRFPHDIPYRGFKERIGVRFVVGVKGRVTECAVTKPSGNSPLDQTVCSLIQRNLRYRPERDRQGRPIPSEIDGEQTWEDYRHGVPDDDDDPR